MVQLLQFNPVITTKLLIVSLDKNFTQLTHCCITVVFYGITPPPPTQCGKDYHRHFVIINTGQKIHGIKLSPKRV